MPSINEITGNNLVSKASNQEAYAEGWERVFGNKEERHEDRIFGKKPKEYKLSWSIILRNSARCLNCNEEIESKHRHDFTTCKCGNLSVDGGLDYLRRIGSPNDYSDLSEVTSEDEEDFFEKVRSTFTWTTYGKDGKGPKQYILLKDLQEDHIKAILETQRHIKGTATEEYLKLELQYREDTNYAPKD